MSHIPLTTGQTLPFTIDALGTFIPPNTELGELGHVIPHPTISFQLRVPGWDDRDMIAARLYSLGVREVSSDQIRSLMISELYSIFPDEAEADDNARFLEGFWQRQQQFSLATAEWDEQEAIRRQDAIIAGIEFEAAPRPVETTSPRERARAALLTSDLTDGSERLRNKLTDQNLYNMRYAALMVRLVVAGWMGLKTEAAFEPRLALDAPVLSKATVDSLRSELMELDGTGAAWDELAAACEAAYDLPSSAEGNSSSQPGSSSLPAGSETKSTASDTSDGKSTSSEETAPAAASPIAPTPGDTSQPTTETLSVSSLVSDTVTTRPSPTAEPSSSSLSA
jgi:hypothetical protein